MPVAFILLYASPGLTAKMGFSEVSSNWRTGLPSPSSGSDTP